MSSNQSINQTPYHFLSFRHYFLQLALNMIQKKLGFIKSPRKNPKDLFQSTPPEDEH